MPYIAHHLDFARRIHALTTIIGQYGITYWKSRTLILFACESVYNGNRQAEYTALRFLALAQGYIENTSDCRGQHATMIEIN